LKFGEIGDTRLTVMAALTVADELSEISVRVKRLEEELAVGKSARVAAAERTKDAEAAVATALEAAADRIEGLAKKINRTIGGNPVPLG
jgi:cell division protein ZapA